MRQVTRKGLITVAAATGVLAVSGGYAHADSGAEGGSSGSPGVLSGNTIQLPVDIPVNACGNTVNVVGLLNPTSGNDCANTSKPGGGRAGGSHSGGHHSGGHHHHGGGATAEGGTSDSPGVGSGNHVQVPVHVPVNACGNSVSVIGLLNPAGGNDCANSPGEEPTTPPTKPPTRNVPSTPHHPVTPSTPSTPSRPVTPNHPGTQTVTQPKGSEQLAETGSSMPLGTVLPAGAGALLAGALLYRRARAGV
ncbi:chaplin [Streptomyces sp. NPDC001939]|uniref:chaplin n=1 Tax=Streptomyces TaxID=1883 RepID=UPI001D0A7977|nr:MULTISPECIES: chaplin [Streptomyces]UDL98880.1 chaplin [Streptomyces longhuiensis]